MGDLTSSREASGRIAPAITFQFEQFASRVCDEGKVDLADRPYKIREWTTLLSARFRDLVASGKMTDDDAARFALEAFGRAEDVAKTLRGGLQGLWHRLRYYERYRFHRLVVPAGVCLLHDWIRMSSSVEYTIVSSSAVGYSFVASNWNHYIGVLFLAGVALPSWAPVVLPVPKRFVRVAALAVTFWLFAVICTEWGQSVVSIFEDFTTGRWHRPGVENVPLWKDALVGGIWSILLLVESVGIVVMIPLLVAEICGFPERRKMRIR